ncbi:uncharacterized protein LOC114331173 [Diabrotica virgifera virgifera]|uniref:Uncharacterized protein n=1 Tax=Diabrotica virgifera virgifera TaxID=50390 RepID=A0ABM5KE38_DIAVI|nr:uncharacterized protein LOC114331173 [Diabrotica virgifera virgifera]
MKLLVIFVAICVSGIQFSEAKRKCCPPPKTQIVITDANVATFVKALKDLVETHNRPEHFQKVVVENIHSVTDKFTVTTETRSLIGDFKKLFKTIYFGLKGVIDLVLPLYTDLFDVEVEVLKKVIRLFVHHNEPLVDLLDKIVIALASVQRVAVLSFIDIILSTPDESP